MREGSDGNSSHEQGDKQPNRVQVYVFKGPFVSGGLSVASVAPYCNVLAALAHEPPAIPSPPDRLVAAGFGISISPQLAAFFRTFGGGAVYRDEETGDLYLGVWGARNASRFRTALRARGFEIEIVRQEPPTRLLFTCANGRRPKR
jgi:hypothetical protein